MKLKIISIKGLIIGFILLFTILYSSNNNSSESLDINDSIFNSKNFSVGQFDIFYDHSFRKISITHRTDSERVIWQTLDNQPFILSSKGFETVEEDHGSFFIDDRKEKIYTCQYVDHFDVNTDTLTIIGSLFTEKKLDTVNYQLSFFQATVNQLSFQLAVDSIYCNRTSLIYYSDPEEHIFGFGEQFTHFDLKGKKVPIFVSEQGIGRGRQPVTFLVDLVANSGGNQFTTYAPVPHYISSSLYSIFLKNSEYSTFDFQEKNSATIEVFSNQMVGGIISGENPEKIIEDYTLFSGRMDRLPDWVHNGAIIGLQGGTDRVFEIVNRLKNNNVEIAAVWLQDWVGQRITSFGKQLWWNWELDTDHYHHWDSLMTFLHSEDIKVLTYINPFLVNVEDKDNYKVNYYEYAKEQSYFVNNEYGNPYELDITTFTAGLLDFTNPDTRDWFKDIVNTNMLSLGVDGWMADFGEALPYYAELYNNRTGADYHNRFPEIWSQLNEEIVEESENKDNLLYFCRSGYSLSPGHTSLFWLGDQLTSWDGHDGIKTAVNGLISSGLSGYSLNHSDVGGYTAIKTPILKHIRSKELFMRWAELNAFTSVLRTHEGNRPDDNHQIYSDKETMAHFSKMTSIYMALGFYRKQLMDEAFLKGLPLVRHPFIHYPDDKNILKLSGEQFMLGDELLIAPVMNKGENEVNLYLPKGSWVHLWTEKNYDMNQGGNYITVNAPIGQPAVFYKKDSPVGKKFLKKLIELGLTIGS